MKYVKWIFVVFFISSLTSFVSKDTPTSGLNVGDIAPNFKLRTTLNDSSFELKKTKGKYVLLNFWASYDAESRMNNVIFNNAIRDKDSNIEMVSVSFDKYESIFNETIRKDQILSSLNDTAGQTSVIFRTYNLEKGFNNYLLDEKGVIIAKNITALELASYI